MEFHRKIYSTFPLCVCLAEIIPKEIGENLASLMAIDSKPMELEYFGLVSVISCAEPMENAYGTQFAPTQI